MATPVWTTNTNGRVLVNADFNKRYTNVRV